MLLKLFEGLHAIVSADHLEACGAQGCLEEEEVFLTVVDAEGFH